MKVVCPVWEGLQQDRVMGVTYGVLILLHTEANESTPANESIAQQMSRGIFGIAESVLRLRPALEEVLAEREAAELARERAIEETKTVLAYQQALQEHVVELEARLGELREAIPPEERKVRTALEALERQAVELRGKSPCYRTKPSNSAGIFVI
jgi:hypothetical protein